MKQKSLGVKARKRIGSVVYHCFMVLLSLTMIYPFVWSVLSSFKTSEQLYGGSPLDLLPKPATLYNYERLFQVLPFGKFVINSFFLAVAMPICMIAVASLTAYALTRLEFKGRKLHLSRLPQPKKGLRGMCWRVGSCSVKWEQSLQKLIFLRKTGIQSRQPLRRQIAFTFQEAIRSSLWMRCENQEQTNC